jgi:hypothetical protein
MSWHTHKLQHTHGRWTAYMHARSSLPEVWCCWTHH